MKYLTSSTNIAAANVTATNILASSAFEILERDAQGSGIVGLSGSYTADADAVFEVEVTSAAISGAPQVSAPVFAGVGNGEISGVSISSGVAAQTIEITLRDSGTVTAAAWAPFQSVELVARATGTSGNAYTLEIDQAGLSATLTDYAVTQALAQDVGEFAGEQYNFGAVTLSTDGTVPADAPRIRFGEDVQVYRHYRTFAGGRYRYHFSPAPRREIPVGTRVYAVSGARSVVLKDGGSTVETFSAVTTLYSLLSQIRDASTRIDVRGVVADDRRPGGMGCDDLSVYTRSYVESLQADGTTYVRRAEIQPVVTASAPSETISIECISADVTGAEIWRVEGPISGRLANAVTGVLYGAGPIGFTIPTALAPGETPAGDKAASLQLVTRPPNATIPVLCVRNFVLGAEARAMTYEFVWTARPNAACDCRGATVRGGPVDDFLGVTRPPGGGGDVADAIPAALQSRAETMTNWKSQLINSNTGFLSYQDGRFSFPEWAIVSSSFTSGTDSTLPAWWGIVGRTVERVSAQLKADRADIRAIETIFQICRDSLIDIYQSKGNTLPSAAATAFDAEFALLQGFVQPLENLVGADFWTKAVRDAAGSATTVGVATAQGTIDEAAMLENVLASIGAYNMTDDLGPIISRTQAAMAKVYVAAGLWSPFDTAVGAGNAVWSDRGGKFWFASSDGLLPIQPGYYYHSAVMTQDEYGRDVPTATKEFGIGVAIGCQDALLPGDRLIIKTGPYANARSTYQQGDIISVQIVRADPVQFGGGVAGNDTLTWAVRGSVAGPLADYSLSLTTPNAYSAGGVGFAITPGAIPFAIGDRYSFEVEGGSFRWRKDSGAWTTTQIASAVALSDGVSATFSGGASPSWVAGDLHRLRAIAVNGSARMSSPDDRACQWSGSTQIDLGSGTASGLLIAAHSIPSDATITLTASDDNWFTTAWSTAVPWAANHIGLAFESRSHAKWRLTINRGGAIGWLYLGDGSQLALPTGKPERGRWRQSIRLGDVARPRGVGGQIEHSACTQASVHALLDQIEAAREVDQGRIGLLTQYGEAAFVRVQNADAFAVEDALNFQAAPSARLLTVTVQVTPI